MILRGNWLFQPDRGELSEIIDPALCLGGRKLLICVEHDPDVGTNRIANGTKTRRIFVWGEPDLKLDRVESLIQGVNDKRNELLAIKVSPATAGVGPDRARRLTPEPVERQTGALRLDVEQGHLQDTAQRE